MKKILVTTDQSTNSKSAIRFAIKLVKLMNAELMVIHVYHILKPFKLTGHAFAGHSDSFRKKTIEELASFVTTIYHDVKEQEIAYQLVLVIQHRCS
jgi:nucleotide-binding universal stress UspA family protein